MMSLLVQVCGEAVTPQCRRLFSEAAFTSCWSAVEAPLDQINSSEWETSELRHILNLSHEGDQQFRAVALLYFQFALWCDSSVPVKRPVSRSNYWKSSNTLLEPRLAPSLQTHVVNQELYSNPINFQFSFTWHPEYCQERCSHKKHGVSLNISLSVYYIASRRAGSRWNKI